MDVSLVVSKSVFGFLFSFLLYGYGERCEREALLRSTDGIRSFK